MKVNIDNGEQCSFFKGVLFLKGHKICCPFLFPEWNPHSVELHIDSALAIIAHRV